MNSNARGWERVVAVLSLDRAVDFYSEVGLNYFNEETWMWLRRWYHEHLENVYVTGKGPRGFAELVANFCEEFGFEEKELARWGKYVANLNDDPLIYCWEEFLSDSCISEEAWQLLNLPSSKGELFRQRCVAATSSLRVFEEADKRDEVPLSDWELAVYSLHGFDDDENSAMNTVALWTIRWNFMRFFREFFGELSKQEQRQFLQAGRELGRHHTNASELRKPDFEDWPRG